MGVIFQTLRVGPPAPKEDDSTAAYSMTFLLEGIGWQRGAEEAGLGYS